MNLFDFVAPVYDIFHFTGKKTFGVLNKLEKFQKTDRILDLGGGAGRISKFLVGKVKKIVVLDLSSKMIERGRRRFGLSGLLGSAEKIPFPDNYFDKIIIVDAFHHFQNQNIACQEIKKVLKINGKLLIEEFNPETFPGKALVKIEGLLKMQSTFHSPNSLDQLFRKYHFKTKIINKNKTIYYLVAENMNF